MLLWTVRILIPALITAAGVVLIIMGHGHYTSVFANRDSLLSAVGMAFIIIALMVILANWLLQLGNESDQDRAKEEEAREHFRRTGEWPAGD